LLLSFGASSVHAQNVYIPDAVFKNYLFNEGADTNGDFEIQVSEAQSFTGPLNISYSTITDLTGLEEFTALESFSCVGVPITSLDLSTNVMLLSLDCVNNKFTSLDLSNNINLTHLICNQQKITSLDLSNNINLVSVDCRQDSFLVSLNVKNGNNTAISTTGFYIYDNPNLTCVEVDDSLYSVTNWTYIDTIAHFSTNCLYLGVTDLDQNTPNLQVYPNPTQNKLTVDLGTFHASVNINILNTIGQSVQSTNYTNSQILDLNIEGLPGWYFIQIETEKGSETIKVLKQ